MIFRKDYSAICDGDDDNLKNPCEKCTKYVFPIGCMMGEDTVQEDGAQGVRTDGPWRA